MSADALDVLTSQQSDEWASPPRIVKPLADAVGGFDLDPCSGAERSPFADNTFTESDNGLAQPWFGNVWVNPPYSDMETWTDKVITESVRGDTEVICFLCKGDSSTDWWQKAVSESTAVCAINGRLSFGNSNNSAPFCSHLIIFGDVGDAVVQTLSDFGLVLSASRKREQKLLIEVEA